MIILTWIIVFCQEKGKHVRISFMEWMLFIAGSIVTIISFMWDYIIYISDHKSDRGVWTLSGNRDMFDEVKTYIPQHFNWGLFWTGEGIILFAVFLIYKRMRK